jgi:cytoskeletal protein CcmA (bactofilin family)
MDKNQNHITPDTIVGPSVKIQGDLNSEGNIQIEGEVEGKINTSENIQIGQNAKVIAEMKAGNAVIAGEVIGNVHIAGSLILLSTANIKGDITCSVLRVEDGAIFSGKCSMSQHPAGSEPEEE